MKRYIRATTIPQGKYNIDVPGGNLRYSVYYKDGVPDYIYLHGVGVTPDKQGQGIGTNLLQKLIAIADKNNLPIELQVAPILNKPMTSDDLIKWYEKNGFVYQYAGGMIYYPNQT